MDNIGRVAQLCNLVCKPELNGSCVVLESYVAGTDQYEVRVLSAPNQNMEDVVLYVKPSNVQYFQSETFASKYPAATTQKGNLLKNQYEPGTILDFADVQTDPQQAAELDYINFVKPCLVIGTACSTNLRDRPSTKMYNGAALNPTLSSYVMECRNIDFVDESAACPQGDQIILRRCHMVHLTLGRGPESVQPAKVFLENCVIDKNMDDGSGVIVSHTSEITMVNCEISNCSCTGVWLDPGAKATFIHCTFTNCDVGIRAENNAVRLINCTFIGCHTALTVLSGVTQMSGCRVEGCRGIGMNVQAPKRAHLQIDNCVFNRCARGILASSGKIVLKLTHTEFDRSEVYGVCFLMNMRGTIDLANCTFRNSARRGMLNLSGDDCCVTVDNVVQPSVDLLSRLAQFKQHGHHAIFGTELDSSAEAGPSKPLRHPIKAMRMMNFCGTYVCKIVCANCQKEETVDEKLKACSKCPYVVYCSRECQVAHWKVHKKECGMD